MSKLVVVSVRDIATGFYLAPQVVAHIGQAVRGFRDACNARSADNPLGQHPEDFELMRLGEFNDQTGLFETGVPEQVLAGKSCVLS